MRFNLEDWDSEWTDHTVEGELYFGSIGKEPEREAITKAGCHAIKRAIIEGDKSNAKVHYDAIKLEGIELKSIGSDVWEVSGKYPPDERNLYSQWKVILNVVVKIIDAVEYLLYEPIEIWTGDSLDKLDWKKE